MTLNLERQLIVYGIYHRNEANIALHMICVPLILFSGFALAANTGTLIPLPKVLTIPHLEPNLGTLAAFVWASLYVLLEPVAGTILGLVCLGATAYANKALSEDPELTNRIAIAVQGTCWLLQLFGHGVLDGRKLSQFLGNWSQAIFLSPLFVWLELLFKFGYRRELQDRIGKAIQAEIDKLKEQKHGKNQ
ncbi:DUF962-domain-containing protein [Annulohypoxylon truncatum]|uniref:DUF962-domain-containing protein n=1 Tax=Annulohypoxylon truncatum TaxID=327061 RepID=UPI0020077A37|nr:DUF962-domain-containing protein [Annulohypoxylon truncatum]KAI1214047.1 DUF962-domain-containing protein [Annulohypoxylon truncatum]